MRSEDEKIIKVLNWAAIVNGEKWQNRLLRCTLISFLLLLGGVATIAVGALTHQALIFDIGVYISMVSSVSMNVIIGGAWVFAMMET